MSREVLAFKIGGFSLINDQLGAALSRQLPEYTFRWHDVIDLCRSHPATYAAATAEAVGRYARKMLEWKLPPSAFLPRTNAFIQFFHRWVRREIPKSVAFTFQTQSLFDANSGQVPHFVYTDHTYLANRRYPSPKPLLPSSQNWLEMERALYRNATANFLSSEFATRSVIEDYEVHAERALSVSLGMNLDFPAEIPVRGDGQRILFVGVQWERKGGPDLVDAFVQILDEFPKAELHIVGCALACPHPRIKLHGRVPREAVAEHLREADVFCLPSRLDPSAAALAEASAYGLPVIGTRVGGNAERVIDGQTGLLVEPERPDQLASALRQLLKNSDLRKTMGAAGRQFAAENFTWEAVAAKIANRIRDELA